MTRQPIEIHIEQLVLHGLAGHDRHAIARAVERHLTETLGAEGISRSLQTPSELEHVKAGEFRLRRGAHSSDVGQQIGRQLSGVFTR
jgi:hypothetical protein